MNIFITNKSPIESAISLPDKHIVKMPLETCQMLAIVASTKWGYGYGTLPKVDGTPYKTERGAFRNHPCTLWAAEDKANAEWLIIHGLALCDEYEARFQKEHGCKTALLVASQIFPSKDCKNHTPFVRAMPDELKLNTEIDTFTAYQLYLNTKPWVYDNYLRIPSRRPDWIYSQQN